MIVVYFRRCDAMLIYLLFYVDAMLIATKDKEEIRRVKA